MGQEAPISLLKKLKNTCHSPFSNLLKDYKWYSLESHTIWCKLFNPRMLQYNTSQNISHAFSKIRNRNINVAGTAADKDYSKLGEYLPVRTL